jgi:hypothetical protein
VLVLIEDEGVGRRLVAKESVATIYVGVGEGGLFAIAIIE